jgi:uncharacterized membrane protein
VNDLPAALLLVAVLFDLAGGLTRRPPLRVAGFWTLVVGGLGAALAVASGLQAEDHIAHGDAVHRVMETHEKLGLITLGIFAFVALWRILREKRMGGTERSAALVLSLVGTGTLVATGMYGGRLVFDHAAGIPTEVLQAEIHERSEGHDHDGGEGGEAAGHDGDAATTDSTATAGHPHAPGTPPHED